MSSLAGYGNLLQAQMPGANQPPTKCRSLAESNLAADLIYAQTELTLRNMYEQILGSVATLRESDNSSAIVANFIDNMKMALSAEGGPCQYQPSELQAYLAVGSDVKRTVCISQKLLNRAEAGAQMLSIETNKANVALLRELVAFIFKRIFRLHKPSSAFRPYGTYVPIEHVRDLHMDAFNSIGGQGKTQRFANVLSRAMGHIGAAQHTARYIVMPQTALPFFETGELVAMSSDFVDDSGFLVRGSPDTYVPTISGLPVIKTQGDENDPLVGQARILQHFCNGGSACDSGNRTIRIQDITTGKNVAVDLEGAIDALRVFDSDGEINETVASVIRKYKRESNSPWHDKYSRNYDPYRTQEMGIWTYSDADGTKQQSRLFGHIPMDRRTQESFARSVLQATGVPGLEPALTRLEALLKDIHRQTPNGNFWAAVQAANPDELAPAHNDETGARRDAKGNNWGVMNHPSLVSPTAPGYDPDYADVLPGWGHGAGLKYVAEAGRGKGALFTKIAEVVDACEIVGQQLAQVLPDWAQGPRPAWLHSFDYTHGMRLIDSMILGGVNLFHSTATGQRQVKEFPALPAGNANGAAIVTAGGVDAYLDSVVDVLNNDTYVTAVTGSRTASSTQTTLVEIINADSSYKEAILPILNRVAALAVAGDKFAGVASLDVRAALVFQSEDANAPIMNILRNILGAWQGTTLSENDVSAEGMPSQDVLQSRMIVRKIAAAIASGNRPYNTRLEPLEGDALSTWYNKIGLDEAAASELLNSRQVTQLATAQGGSPQTPRTRLPLLLSGLSATGFNLLTVAPPATGSGAAPAAPTAASFTVGSENVPFGESVTPARPAPPLPADSIYARNTIGARYGAGPSNSGAPSVQQFSDEYEPPVTSNNKRIARMLKTPYKLILLALFRARLTAGNFRGLFSCNGVDAPVGLLLVRAPFFERVEHVIVTEGSTVNEIVHEPIRVHPNISDCGEFYKANIVVTATGIVRGPGGSAVLPNARVERPLRHTADVSFMDGGGRGALIPIIVPRDWECPDQLNLNGIDEHGNIHIPSAPIVHALWHPVIAEITNKDFLWTEDSISYRGHQITYDHDGHEREVSALGSFTDIYHRY